MPVERIQHSAGALDATLRRDEKTACQTAMLPIGRGYVRIVFDQRDSEASDEEAGLFDQSVTEEHDHYG